MNTREINGSAWQLKHFFITAIPLAVLTILLPLIVLPTFNFIWRLLAAHSPLRSFFLIVTTLILNMYLDIISRAIKSRSLQFAYLLISMFVAFLSALSLGVKLIGDINPGPSQRHGLWEEKWRLLFYLLAIACFFARSFVYPFLELPPYLVYFLIIWHRDRKQKSKLEGAEP